MANYFLVFLLLLFSPQLYALDSEYSQKSNLLNIKNFKFNNGEALPNLKLHYLTLGKPKYNANKEITNAILLFHATINDAHSFLQPDLAPFLFKPGAPLDATKFYIIIPDGIGAGGSSKPSDGLKGSFPKYGYKDQIKASKALIDALGISHLKMVLGTSMGGMLAWLWGEAYPDSVDVLVPIVSTPLPVSGRNFIWREMMLKAIENDPLWQNGHYDSQKTPYLWRDTVGPLNSIMIGTATMLRGASDTRSAAIEEYKGLVNSLVNSDPSDWYFIVNSSYDYDPVPNLKKIKAEVVAINFKDDLINPLEFIHLADQKNMHHLILPGGFGHLSFAHGRVWVDSMSAFLKTLPGRND